MTEVLDDVQKSTKSENKSAKAVDTWLWLQQTAGGSESARSLKQCCEMNRKASYE